MELSTMADQVVWSPSVTTLNYTVSRKKETKMFCNISCIIRAILMIYAV